MRKRVFEPVGVGVALGALIVIGGVRLLVC